MRTRLQTTFVLALLLALTASAASDYEAMCCLSGPSLTYSAQSITPDEIPPYGEVSVSVMVSNNGDMAAIALSPLEVYSSPTGFYGSLAPIDGTWLVPRGSSKIFAGVVTAPGTEGGYELYSDFAYSSAVDCGITHNGTLNISLGAVTVRQVTPTSCYLVPSSFTTAVGSFTSIAAHCEMDGVELPCPSMEWITDGGVMSPATTSPQLSPSSTLTAQSTPAAGRAVTASSATLSCSASFEVVPGPPAKCSISPATATLAPSALQTFYLSCSDSNGNSVFCYPSTAWYSTVGSMNPSTSPSSSTLTAQAYPGTGYVKAYSSAYGCYSYITVLGPPNCSLSANPPSITGPASSVITATFANLPTSQTTALLSCSQTDAGQDVAIVSGTATRTCNYPGVSSPAIYAASSSASTASCSTEITNNPAPIPATCSLSSVPSSITGPASSVITATFANLPTSQTTALLSCSASDPGQSVAIVGGAATRSCNYPEVFSATTYLASSSASAAYCSTNITNNPKPQPASCSITPASSSIYVGATRAFSLSCFDAQSLRVSCPSLAWSTNGGSMSPQTTTPQLSPSSTLTAQTTPASGRTVTASSGNFSCSASFDVLPGSASQCAISPPSAVLAPSSTGLFSLSCFDSYRNPVPCYPSTTWSSTVGTMNPATSPTSSTLTAQNFAGSGHVKARCATSCYSYYCYSYITVTGSPSCSLSAVPSSLMGPASSVITATFTNLPTSQTTALLSCSASDPGQSVAISGGIATRACSYPQVFAATAYAASSSASTAYCTTNITNLPRSADSCVLSPEYASLAVSETQEFTAFCFSGGYIVDCPPIQWSSGAGPMEPASSTEGSPSSTLTAANVGSYVVMASSQSFFCSSDVEVSLAHGPATSCEVLPPQATLPAGGTALFSVSCRNAQGLQTDCPPMTWSSDVGSMSPAWALSSMLTAGLAPGSGSVWAYNTTTSTSVYCSSSINVTSQIEGPFCTIEYVITPGDTAADITVRYRNMGTIPPAIARIYCGNGQPFQLLQCVPVPNGRCDTVQCAYPGTISSLLPTILANLTNGGITTACSVMLGCESQV